MVTSVLRNTRDRFINGAPTHLFYQAISRETVFKARGAFPSGTLHVIVPHCTNWKLTRSTVQAFLRLTRRPCVVTVINNYDTLPTPRTEDAWWEDPRIEIRSLELNPVGAAARRVIRKRVGSEENAQALDLAISRHPTYEWAFMSHSDSAPLCRNWDDAYFDALDGGRILGNYRDPLRIRAAHASGTLFSQKDWLDTHESMRPVFRAGRMILDVGDLPSVKLHDPRRGPVPVLPNTTDSPELLKCQALAESAFQGFAANNSVITFDKQLSRVVFGHMGRGTPRNLSDASYSHKLPVDVWIELVDSVR